MNTVLFAILAYVRVQFAIGAVVSRRMASKSDYILAGRRAGVVTFSVFATYFGAEAIVASGGRSTTRALPARLSTPSAMRARSSSVSSLPGRSGCAG